MAFCVRKDVENKLSAWGVLQASDDNADGAADGSIIAQCIEEAEMLILERIGHIYDSAGLTGTTWAKHRGAFVAACCLMRRRAQALPDGLKAQWDELMSYLNKVSLGELLIPDAQKIVPSSGGPTISNFHMDDQHMVDKDRVIRRKSVGPADTPGVARPTDRFESLGVDIRP